MELGCDGTVGLEFELELEGRILYEESRVALTQRE